jgi:hypothetical protein
MGDNVSEPLHRARAGRIPERNVSPYLIVIGGVLRKNSPKVFCVEHDQMIVHWWRPTAGSQHSLFGSGHALLERSAAGLPAHGISIVSMRQNPFDANARRSRA